MSARLAVIGIGEDGLAGLGPRAHSLLDAAELLIGGARHLAFLGDDPRPRIAWRSPLEATLEEIRAAADRRAVVLASGDPSWFGVASLLRRSFGDAIEIVPAVSAFQLACARLGWPLEATSCISLHGRPIDALHRQLGRGGRLLALTGGADDPPAIAALLTAAGFGAARLLVLERIGGRHERLREGTAARPPEPPHDLLNVVALDLTGAGLPLGRPAVPGLPDDAFAHDGQITKREVRAVTLAALAPRPGELLWDIGAGAGSVAIEWLRAAADMSAIAIERESARAARARANASSLGVPQLRVLEAEAPGCLQGLPEPQAVFVGGGIAAAGVLDAGWAALGPGGRLVANAVTLDGEAALLAFRAARGGELTRLQVSRAEPIGGLLAWRPSMAITQLSVSKSCVAAS